MKACSFGGNARPQHHRHLLAVHGRVGDQVQVVRAGLEVPRVDQQTEAAVGELGPKRCRAGVAEPEFRIVQRLRFGWNVQPYPHAIDAAALDALEHRRTRIQGIADDQKIAVGVQLLAGFWRLDADDQ
jgi:hypothetical protein